MRNLQKTLKSFICKKCGIEFSKMTAYSPFRFCDKCVKEKVTENTNKKNNSVKKNLVILPGMEEGLFVKTIYDPDGFRRGSMFEACEFVLMAANDCISPDAKFQYGDVVIGVNNGNIINF